MHATEWSRECWSLSQCRKAALPQGFEVTWRSYPLFDRVYEPQPAGR